MPRILESQSQGSVGVLEPGRPQRPSVPVICKYGDFKIIVTAATNGAYHVLGTFLNFQIVTYLILAITLTRKVLLPLHFIDWETKAQ